MSRLLFWLGDLALFAFGVYCLLFAYQLVGKPRGSDPVYDARHDRSSGLYKVLGWGWVVVSILGLIGRLTGPL
jgi:hypothetical protein